MQLNSREASLVEAFRRLPPDTAAELSALAERLARISHRKFALELAVLTSGR